MTISIREPIEIDILLIIEELKSRKLFYVLGKVGSNDCFFQVHLDFVIMDLLGMNDGKDATYAIYDAIDKLLEAKKSLFIQNPIQ